MNIKIKKLAKALAGVAVLVATQNIGSAATLNITAGTLFSDLGTTPLADGSTVVLIADTAGDGFGDFTDPASVLGDANNVLLDSVSFDSAALGFGAGNASMSFTWDNGAAGVSEGDNILMVWYAASFNPTAAGPGNDVNFGTFRTDTPLDGGLNWQVPANNVNGPINFQTGSFFGSEPNNVGFAGVGSLNGGQTQPIPEPSTYALLGLGSIALVALRRWKKKA